MIRWLISIFFLCTASFVLQGQQYSYIDGDALEFYRSQKQRENPGGVITAADIVGTPYLQEEFAEGVIYTGLNKRYQGIPLRYNIYNDQIEYKTDKEVVLAISNPETISRVELREDKIVYRPYMIHKRMKYGFFLMLEEGLTSLLVKKVVIIQNPKKAGAYQEAEPAKFIHKSDTYYLQEEGKPAEYIANKKMLPELFPENKKEVAAFIKKNKVKYNKPESLIELVRYYNGLLAN